MVRDRINLENSRLTTLGIKNNLLPTLAVNGALSNSGLAGQTNSLGQVPVYGPRSDQSGKLPPHHIRYQEQSAADAGGERGALQQRPGRPDEFARAGSRLWSDRADHRLPPADRSEER